MIYLNAHRPLCGGGGRPRIFERSSLCGGGGSLTHRHTHTNTHKHTHKHTHIYNGGFLNAHHPLCGGVPHFIGAELSYDIFERSSPGGGGGVLHDAELSPLTHRHTHTQTHTHTNTHTQTHTQTHT